MISTLPPSNSHTTYKLLACIVKSHISCFDYIRTIKHFSFLDTVLPLLLGIVIFGNAIPKLLAETGTSFKREIVTVEEYALFLNSIEASSYQKDKKGASLEFYDPKMAEGNMPLLLSESPDFYYYHYPGLPSRPLTYLSREDIDGYCYWLNRHQKTSFYPEPSLGRDIFFEVDPALRSSTLSFSLRSSLEIYQTSLSVLASSEEIGPIASLLEEMVAIIVIGSKTAYERSPLRGDFSHERRESSPKSQTDLPLLKESSSLEEDFEKNVRTPTLTESLLEKRIPCYRLQPHGWEKKTATGWSPTDRFKKLQKTSSAHSPTLFNQALSVWIKNSCRINETDQERKFYQKEASSLKALPSSLSHSNKLKEAVTLEELFKHALHYQKIMVEALTKMPEEENKMSSKYAYTLGPLLKISEAPNLVEQSTKKIKEEYQQLADYQKRLSEIELLLPLLVENQAIDTALLPHLTRSKNKLLKGATYLNQAIKKQEQLLQERIGSTLLLTPTSDLPSKSKSSTTPSFFEKRKWHLVNEEAIHQKKSTLAAKQVLPFSEELEEQQGTFDDIINSFQKIIVETLQKKPQQHIIDLFYKSKTAYQKILKEENLSFFTKKNLRILGSTLFSLGLEYQQPQPHLEAIATYQKVAQCYQEALEKEQINPTDRSCCEYTGQSLLKLLFERKKEKPNAEVISFYKKSLEFHKQTIEEKDPVKKRCLRQIAYHYFNIGVELQKLLPNEEIIHFSKQVIDCYQQALPREESLERECLLNSGTVLFFLIEEIKELGPNAEIIELCHQSVALFQQASGGQDRLEEEKKYLFYAGNTLLNLIHRVKYEPLNQEVESLSKEAASSYQKAAYTQNKIQRESYAYLGAIYSRKIKELLEPTPNENVLKEFNNSIDLFQQALTEIIAFPFHPTFFKADCLNDAAKNLYEIGLELQKISPNQQKIERFRKESDFYQKLVNELK